ncbi:TatD family hydrolase [Buchnera aphidicola (Chaitoregma tattakana)]|uniref:TatD family hydrolase n=1 Tax=Buchnera aphidicola TaxID=9 RepID=UPI0031B81237
MILIDSHCHLDKINFKKINKTIEDVMEESEKKHVKYFLNVSTSIKNFDKMKLFLKNRKNIFYSCGIHPFYYEKNIRSNQIIKRLKDTKVIAVGETGLDYSHKNIISKQKQEKLFIQQIKISKKVEKPLIIHTRNSIQDVIKILKNFKIDESKVIIHSFNETNIEIVKKIIELNFYFSISGIVTFKNAKNLRKIIEYLPLNRILIETDSPYLSPEPNRGKVNTPSNLYYIIKCIAKIKKIDLLEISKIMIKNFQKLFNLKIKI